MRLIDADELIEHAYRDRLDSRELIANMINNAPTVKEIPVNVPLSLVIKELEQEPILDKIRAEMQFYSNSFVLAGRNDLASAVSYCIEIIDKYRQGMI